MPLTILYYNNISVKVNIQSFLNNSHDCLQLFLNLFYQLETVAGSYHFRLFLRLRLLLNWFPIKLFWIWILLFMWMMPWCGYQLSKGYSSILYWFFKARGSRRYKWIFLIIWYNLNLILFIPICFITPFGLCEIYCL